MEETEIKKISGPSSSYRINESVGMVCIAAMYLRNVAGIPSRGTKERFRDVLTQMVQYEKKPYHGSNNRGGYIFDRDSLWNDFFLDIPEFKKIIEHRRITSLDELEDRALAWQAEQQAARMTSLDEMLENGIEPDQSRYTYDGKRRKPHNDFE